MAVTVLKLDSQSSRADRLRQASDVLNGGGLVAFPTETVYGLGVRADVPAAMDRLRAVKTRDAAKAFTVHIAARDDAQRFVTEMSGVAARLVRKAWPGPLTLILPVADPSATAVMVGKKGAVAAAMFYDHSVGLRCPDDAVAQQVLRAVEGPVVAASANLAGEPPPWTADDVLRSLADHIDLLIDSGRTKYGKPSTIVRVTGESVEVLREGVYDAGSITRLSTVRVLFVCTGNTCRSPLAATLAEKMLADRLGCRVEDLGEHGVVVGSAGTSGGFGSASPHAIAVLAQRGLDLRDHASTALTADLLQRADYVFAMTRAHRDRILEMVPSSEHRVHLLLENDDIHDPMGGAKEEYEVCARTIEEALAVRLREVFV